MNPMDEQQIAPSTPKTATVEDSNASQEIPVRLRDNIQAAVKRAADQERAQRLSADEAILPALIPADGAPAIPDDEKTWAAVAHASTLFTVILALSSAGLASLIGVAVPLLIYMQYRHKSEYVARHALQAFSAQMAGIVGFTLLVLVGTLVWGILFVIAVLLSLVVIGIPFLILLLIVAVIALPLSLALPFATVLYSLMAAVEAWNGRPYSYPWIGPWVEKQLNKPA
jgi:hypothetical protein